MAVGTSSDTNKGTTAAQSQEELVSEQIDPRILEVLGLQDVFDLTYEEYLTELKQKMVEGRMNNSSMSTEDVELVTNEYKRVKGKTGKFKVKKIKIDPKKLFGRDDKENENKEASKNLKLLPPSQSSKMKKVDEVEEEKKSPVEDLLPIVTEIKDIVIGISDILQKQLDFKKKLSDISAKETEKQSRADTESRLESKPSGKLKSIGEKIVKPFTSIFDRIKNFLLMTLLGSVANWLFGVFRNPKKLLQPIQNLMDGIVGFFNNILQWIDNSLINPIRGFVDLIQSGINGFIGLVNQVLKFIPGSPQLGEVDIPNIPDIPDLKAPDIVGKEENVDTGNKINLPNVQIKNKGGLIISPNINLMRGGGENKSQKQTKSSKIGSIDSSLSEAGGIVKSDTGLTVTGLGQDTQLTALRKNEFVLVPGAAAALGIPFLESLNKKFGGDNKERFVSLDRVQIRKAQGGGQVARESTNGGNSPKKTHPYLDKLGDKKIKKASAPPGYCVTGSLDTMQKSGVPNPAATGNDVGNNPRGAAVQLIRSFGWKSIGGTKTTLKSPYGTVSTGIFSKGEYDKAVKGGKIPSGALIFQTRHSSWNGTSYNSRGYDMAIAQQKGAKLWNGQSLGQWVYGNTTKVIALTPGGVAGDGTPPTISPGSSTDPSSLSPVDDESMDTSTGGSGIDFDSIEPWMIKGDPAVKSPTSSTSSILSPSSITPTKSPLIPPPPSGQKQPLVIPITVPNKKQQSSGSMSGSTGTPPVDFPSENLSELAHKSAVKSLLNILEY